MRKESVLFENSQFIKDFRYYFKSLPPTNGIYHYTDVTAFLNIVQNGKLWATHINFMNDSLEGYVGIRLVERILQIVPKVEYLKSKALVIEKFKNELNKCQKSMNIFIISFTSVADDLNQWRGYANSPNGINVGFNANILASKILTSKKIDKIVENMELLCETNIINESQFYFLKCLYDENFQHNLVYSALDLLPDDYNDLKTIRQVARLLSFCTPFFKEKSFNDEKEWRLAIFLPSTSNEIKFRAGKSYIIPYIEFPYNCSSIKSITLAPSNPDKKIQRDSVEYFAKLISRNQPVSIEESSIPYRNW